MWSSCVDFFAAGASQDRGWHVLQRQLECHGRVRFKWREVCIALMIVRLVLPSVIMLLSHDAHGRPCGRCRRLRRAGSAHGH